MDLAKLYLKAILAERQWSWALIGIAYLAVSLFIRQLIFRNIVRTTKAIDPHLYHGVKNTYLKNSLGGWSLFLISFLLVVVVWLGWQGSPVDPKALALFGLALPVLYFLSLILHLLAYVRALLNILQQKMGVEKEF